MPQERGERWASRAPTRSISTAARWVGSPLGRALTTSAASARVVLEAPGSTDPFNLCSAKWNSNCSAEKQIPRLNSEEAFLSVGRLSQVEFTQAGIPGRWGFEMRERDTVNPDRNSFEGWYDLNFSRMGILSWRTRALQATLLFGDQFYRSFDFS